MWQKLQTKEKLYYLQFITNKNTTIGTLLNYNLQHTIVLEVETDSSNTWGMFRNMDGTATVDIDAGSIIYVGFGRTEGSTAQKPRINYTLTGITR